MSLTQRVLRRPAYRRISSVGPVLVDVTFECGHRTHIPVSGAPSEPWCWECGRDCHCALCVAERQYDGIRCSCRRRRCPERQR